MKQSSLEGLCDDLTSSLCVVQLETIRVNVLGMLNLADLCLTHNIHLTTYATGCIFHYDVDFPEGTGKGFTELDTPNFTGSYYSHTKVILHRQDSSGLAGIKCEIGLREWEYELSRLGGTGLLSSCLAANDLMPW